jgi:hypothetical protein
LTFEEIFSKVENREFVIVHMKENMSPKIIEPETGSMFSVPEGYLEYDCTRYFRKH